MYLKNTASQKLEVFAFDYTTGAPKTGDAANLLAYVNIDEAGYATLGDTSATEVDSTNKKGLYLFDLAQAETNGTKLGFFAKSTTSGVSVICRPSVSFTQPATGILAPTTAGRTLDVSATGEAGVDWANVGSPATTLALTGTTIADTQKIDVNTIKTQAVTCAAGVTVNVNVGTTQPVNFSGTGATAYVKGDVTQWLAVAPLALSSQQVQAVVPVTQKVDVETIKTQTITCAAGVTVLASVGTASASTAQTGDSFARIGATGSSLTSLAPAATALSTVQWSNALATLLGGFVFTVPGFVDANIQYVNDVAVTGTGAPGFEWGPA